MQRAAIGVFLAATVAGCSADRLNVPPFNNPTPDGIANDARAAVQLQISGILDVARAQAPVYVRDVGIMGREAFNYTLTEGRNTTGYLVNPEDPTSFSATVSWAGRFQVRRNVYALEQVVANTQALTDAEKQATLGLAWTMDAVELSYLVLTRDALGVPVDVLERPTDVAIFVSRDSAWRVVSARLDAAYTALQAGGATFPFTVTAGFAGFNTPATFAQANRGLAARMLVYRATMGCGNACYTQALTALGQSFVSTAAPLDRGVNHVYSIASGDRQNTINAATDANTVAHPSITADAPRRADNSFDLRYVAKIRTVPARGPGGTVPGITTTIGQNRYPQQITPIPLVRNEELILLRAEARYFTGDQPGALADINFIRTTSGGLEARGAFTSDADFITELLLQRRMSLFLEGHRWFDVRRFGRLDTLPVDVPQHKVVANWVVPQGECQVRKATGDPALAGPGCP